VELALRAYVPRGQCPRGGLTIRDSNETLAPLWLKIVALGHIFLRRTIEAKDHPLNAASQSEDTS
jgi:hypothetical protein